MCLTLLVQRVITEKLINDTDGMDLWNSRQQKVQRYEILRESSWIFDIRCHKPGKFTNSGYAKTAKRFNLEVNFLLLIDKLLLEVELIHLIDTKFVIIIFTMVLHPLPKHANVLEHLWIGSSRVELALSATHVLVL
jgi:hypothetical protein